MSAPSLYRRHRPRSFDDVVGQEHVVRTLRNAIEQDKVHHAYLFVGSRGTGKTSMAKILAACLNCQGDPDLPQAERRPGPTTHPCGRCEACRSIADATSIDVVEMDAASNNSVDDIRDLRDSVAFAPVGGRHKVYILDEAHMLSSQAWNAFLKTLEEPPPRTIFVLATTEANKVLPTVVDRCHRFDFHRPTPVQLSRVLDRVAQQERIDIGPEAVALVARHATGSFRDALGTLEQLVTYAGEDIRVEDVLSVLGVADAELLFRAFDAVGAGDAAATLQVAAELSAQGRDLTQVTKDVEAHARALLLVLMTGALPDELRISPDRDERTVAQARTLSGATIIRVIDLVAAALAATKDGADPRTQLELLLVRAALPQIDPQAKALAARIARLEQAAQGAAPPPAPAIPVAAPAPPVAPAAPAAPPVSVAPTATEPVPPASDFGPPGPSEEARLEGAPPTAPPSAPAEPAPTPVSASGAPAATPPIEPTRPVDAPPSTPPIDPARPVDAPASTPPIEPAPPIAPAPPIEPARSADAPGSTPPIEPARPSDAPASTPPVPSPDPASWSAPVPADPAPESPATAGPPPAELRPPTAADVPPAPSGPSPIGLGPADVDEQLPGIAEQMGGAVRAALSQARAVSITGSDLLLGVPAGKATAARTINREDAKERIAAELEELLGVRYVIHAAEQADVVAAEEPLLPEDEVVRRLVTEFGAEEVADGGAGPADPSVAPETTTRTPGDS